MDSSVNPQNYANSSDVRLGSQIIELNTDEVKYDNPVGKFIFNYITPDNTGDAYEKTLPKNNTHNIINNNNMGITRITSSNFIELTIPKHLFTIKEIKITTNVTMSDGYHTSCNPVCTIIYNSFYKGQKFIITNLSGNINKPYIIGVA